MDYELIAQKVLRTMTCIREFISVAKSDIRNCLDKKQPNEAILEYKKLKTLEDILKMLEEDFKQTEG